MPAYNDVRAGMAKQEYDFVFIHPAHVAMAEIKGGRYKAVAWTSGYTDYTVSLLVNAGTTLKSLDDLKGNTLVTPDPDSITAMMVRAMLRTSKLPVTTAKPDGQNAKELAASVRVISTRYQDAVPFYIENGFAQAGATAAKSVVKAWTDKGGKVLAQSRAVPIKQLLVSSAMPAEEQERIRAALLGHGAKQAGEGCTGCGRLQGLRRDERRGRGVDDRMAWPVAPGPSGVVPSRDAGGGAMGRRVIARVLAAAAGMLAACSPAPTATSPLPITPPSEVAGAAVVRKTIPEPAPATVPPAPRAAPRNRHPARSDLRLRLGSRRRANDDGDRILAQGRRAVREGSGDGTLPVRAQRLPQERRPRLCRQWRRDHDGDGSGVRQEGHAHPAQVELRRDRPR